MTKQANYLAGWIDTTIHDFLIDLDGPTSSLGYALITCLDSDCNIPSLMQTSKHLRKLKGKVQLVGQGLLLTTRQLLTAERHNRLFFGFDEVWFFPTSDIAPKPASFVITGPDPITSPEVARFDEWLHSNHCSLGIGDGVGMNFCLRVRGMARYIVEAFNGTNSLSVEEQRDSTPGR